jgi:hypothetical protein
MDMFHLFAYWLQNNQRERPSLVGSLAGRHILNDNTGVREAQ